MKKSFFALFVSISLFSFSSIAEPRTDGPRGSEYGDFSNWEYAGRFSLGADFGALVPNNTHASSTIAVGAHLTYNPLDLVGIRLQYLQSLQKPRNSLFSLGATGSVDLANVRPYAFFGPGIQIAHYANTTTKFMLQFGGGADVLVTDDLAIGLSYLYSAVFDIIDTHYIGASLTYTF